MGEWVADREARAAEPELIVPDMVKTFVAYFYRHIREKNVYEILTMYETSFHKLSERYFKASPWPSEKAVAPLVEHDHVFCLLYKEMYYRHLYARLTPTLEQRCESWDNYCALFGVILHGNVNMQLPNIWLWEMVDEFIYQFQSFCQYRGKLSTKSPEELELLKRCDGVWNVLGVLNYLQALIDKSGIVDTLSKERDGEEAFSVNDGYDYSASNVLRLLGYFSMVGLLRVHCLIGDYRSAVKAVEPIDLDKSGMFTKVPGCYITTLYYIGFALMMQSRYCDANRTFNTILLYIQRTKAYHQRTAIYDQVLKKNEQLYALVAVCLSICPASVKFLDEGCAQVLREKYNDKMVKMAAGEVALYDELFSYACPKFITPCPPSFEDPSVNVNQEAFRLQLGLFLEEVRHQAVLPTMRSYLKLYTTISLSKLAALLELDEYAVRTTLLSLKQKSRQPSLVAGRNVLDAEWAAATDIDFYIDDDMVHVVDNKVQRQYGDYFATHIVKNERMALEISRIAEVITTEI
jgi:translation initiation factor 3 subunit L